MATVANQVLSEEFGTELWAEPELTQRGEKVKVAHFFARIEHRWATRLVAGPLFEPSATDLDRRHRGEQLATRLIRLRQETERQGTFPTPLMAGR